MAGYIPRWYAHPSTNWPIVQRIACDASCPDPKLHQPCALWNLSKCRGGCSSWRMISGTFIVVLSGDKMVRRQHFLDAVVDDSWKTWRDGSRPRCSFALIHRSLLMRLADRHCFDRRRTFMSLPTSSLSVRAVRTVKWNVPELFRCSRGRYTPNKCRRSLLLLGRIAAVDSDAAYFCTHGAAWSVCLFVSLSACVSVSHVRDPWKKRLNWSGCRLRGWLGWINHVLDGARSPKGMGQFLGCPHHWKALGAFAAVYAKPAEPIEMPFGGWLMWAKGIAYYMGLRPMRRVTIRRCGLLSKILWPLIIVIIIIIISSSSNNSNSMIRTIIIYDTVWAVN